MKRVKNFVVIATMLLFPVTVYSQPKPGEIPFNTPATTFDDIFAAYYKKENILPFAKCQIFSPDGKSSYDLPFLFLRTFGRRPVAVDYTNVIEVKSSLVFIADEEKAWRGPEGGLKGKIALVFDDLPSEIEIERKAQIILQKVRLAEKLQAKAMVIVPNPEAPYLNHPYYSVDYTGMLPSVSIAYRDAEEVFRRENIDLRRIWEDVKVKNEKRTFIELRQKMRVFLDSQFETEEGEHFIIFYKSQFLPKEGVLKILQEREKAYSAISQEIGVEKTSKLILFFYPNAEMKTFFTWHVGYSLTWGDQDHEIRNNQVEIDDYRETAYYLLDEIGESISFLKEGASVYFVNKLRGTYEGKMLNEWMRVFLEEESSVSLPLVLGFYIGSPESKVQISSAEAGAFVDFLIKKFGIDKFKTLYYLVSKGGNPNILKNVEILELVFGKEWKELEKEWIDQPEIGQSFKNKYLEKSQNVWEEIKSFKFSEEIREKLEKDENNADLWLEISYYLTNERDYDRAIKALNKYLELKPDDFQGFGLLGLTHSMAGDFEKAEMNLEKSLSLGTKSLLPHFYLGLVRMSLGNWNGAKKEMLHVIERAPQSTLAKKAQIFLSEIIYY